jgi:hypothetical protein
MLLIDSFVIRCFVILTIEWFLHEMDRTSIVDDNFV